MDNFDSLEYSELYFKPLTLTDDVEETLSTPKFEELKKPVDSEIRSSLPMELVKSTRLPFENDLQIEIFNNLFQKETASRRDTYGKLTGHYDSIMLSAQAVDHQMDVYSDNLDNMFQNLKLQVKDMETTMLKDSKDKIDEILRNHPQAKQPRQEIPKQYK